MPSSDRGNFSESQLIGHSVLDRQGHALGKVQMIKTFPKNGFALVVPFPISATEVDNLLIESHHLTEINWKLKIIKTDLEVDLVTPSRGKTIPLWAEQLVVNRQRRRTGEVVVRKVIETDWVRVPVYREKLVVQTEGDAKPLAEVSLGESQITGAFNPESPSDRPEPGSSFSLSPNYSLEEVIQILHQLPSDSNFPTTITLLLSQNPDSQPEPIRMEFPSLQAATQTLMTLKAQWGQRCQGVVLAGQT